MMKNQKTIQVTNGIGSMAKHEIGQLEPYLDKRLHYCWLPSTNVSLLRVSHLDEQRRKDCRNISDYLLWSIINFILFFVLGIICLILSIRVRELKPTENYQRLLNLSQRTLALNIVTTIVGLTFLITMFSWLINKSSSNF